MTSVLDSSKDNPLVTDAVRKTAAKALREAVDAGQLTNEEFETRLNAIEAARTFQQVNDTLEDLSVALPVPRRRYLTLENEASKATSSNQLAVQNNKSTEVTKSTKKASDIISGTLIALTATSLIAFLGLMMYDIAVEQGTNRNFKAANAATMKKVYTDFQSLNNSPNVSWDDAFKQAGKQNNIRVLPNVNPDNVPTGSISVVKNGDGYELNYTKKFVRPRAIDYDETFRVVTFNADEQPSVQMVD